MITKKGYFKQISLPVYLWKPQECLWKPKWKWQWNESRLLESVFSLMKPVGGDQDASGFICVYTPRGIVVSGPGAVSNTHITHKPQSICAAGAVLVCQSNITLNPKIACIWLQSALPKPCLRNHVPASSFIVTFGGRIYAACSLGVMATTQSPSQLRQHIWRYPLKRVLWWGVSPHNC